MRVLISIDDTDNLESPGTGKLAAAMIQHIENAGWGRCERITRHQLYVHPDIPYTSHNSAMCFEADVNENDVEHIIGYASDFLATQSAPGSDPGLCLLSLAGLTRADELIAFGWKAKQAVLNKKEAYELASQLGVHLSEHGGTGQGIIGALAGAGLRLSGNDGRYRGRLEIGAEGDVLEVGDIRTQAKVDEVKSLGGTLLEANERVRLGEKVKAVLQSGKSVLLVTPTPDDEAGAKWQTCSREQIKAF